MKQVQKKVILITGVTGMAGSEIIREFVRNKYPVRALVRNRDKAIALAVFPTVEIVEGDMTKENTLTDAFAGVDRILMISSSTPDMAETQSLFIDAAKNAGIKHIIKFSGLSAADVNSSFIFANLHAKAERHLENAGIAWTHLRPSQFMTEYLREVPTILAHNALFLPLQDAKLTPVDLRDVAKAAFTLLTTEGHEGKIYAISGPEALDMQQVADQISQAIDQPVHYVKISLDDRKQALLDVGIPPFFVDVLDAQARERLKGAESEVHTETHTALGIKPTSFAQFAKRNASSFLGESVYLGLQ